MDILQQILHTYAQFFDWHMWQEVLTSPTAWGLILSLIVLEGLLSADNALVLAVMVKHLPEKQRKRALFYGLLGAYVFRFIAIGLGTFLIKLWYVKAIGSAYLAWIAIKYFISKGEEESEVKAPSGFLVRLVGTFWATVASVELMDIAFSVDSVLASFGVSEEVWVLLLGGMLGILMMRGVAQLFLFLIDKIPELETTAYILILIIAAKMALTLFHIHISHALFFSVLVLTFVFTFVVHAVNKKNSQRSMNKAS